MSDQFERDDDVLVAGKFRRGSVVDGYVVAFKNIGEAELVKCVGSANLLPASILTEHAHYKKAFEHARAQAEEFFKEKVERGGRIAELEAERDRLRDAIAELVKGAEFIADEEPFARDVIKWWERLMQTGGE